MSQIVTIKSNKYGINLILNPDVEFEELLKGIKEKFQSSGKFFKDSKLSLSLEGRDLSQKEEEQVLDTITQNSSIEIICVMDHDETRINKMREQYESYCDLIEQQYAEVMHGQGEFYKGTLRSGQTIESASNVIIVGDVNPGAKIVAGGNIIILGTLKGNVHAGAYGNQSSFVFALEMNPIQIQIAEFIAKSPDKQKTKKVLLRKTKDNKAESQIAFAKDGCIYIENVSKSTLNSI